MSVKVRNPYFDISRAVCLIILCAFHYFTYLYYNTNSVYLSLGSYALPFFFTLSGYLIHQLLSKSLLTRKYILNFYKNRFIRLAPAYLVVLTLSWLFGTFSYPLWALTYALNFKIYLISLDPTQTFSYISKWYSNGTHYWSMGVEEQFYLLYPLLLILFNKSRRIQILLLSIICFSIFHYLIQKTHPTSYFGVLLPVPGQYVLWGALMSELNLRKLLPRFRHQSLFAFMILFLSIYTLGIHRPHAFIQFQPTQYLNFIAIPMAFLVYSLDVMPKYQWTDLFISRAACYVGRISYGVYLLHVFLIESFLQVTAKFELINTPLSFTLFFILSTTLGVVLWELIEKPISTKMRKSTS